MKMFYEIIESLPAEEVLSGEYCAQYDLEKGLKRCLKRQVLVVFFW